MGQESWGPEPGSHKEGSLVRSPVEKREADPQMDGPITVYPNRKVRSLIKPWSIKMVR